jgi:hypothetical protein
MNLVPCDIMPSGYTDTTQALLYSKAHWTNWLDHWRCVVGVQRSFLLQSRICDCSQCCTCIFSDWRFNLYCHLSKWGQLYLVSNNLHNIYYILAAKLGVWQPAFTISIKNWYMCTIYMTLYVDILMHYQIKHPSVRPFWYRVTTSVLMITIFPAILCIWSWLDFRYSACVLCSDSVCDLTLASGTVFNKILLWHISDGQISKRPEPDSRVKVSLTLSGHEAREKLAPEYTVEWMQFNDCIFGWLGQSMNLKIDPIP